ncbi:g1951 [Coccomyxa elongata]
MADDEAMTGLFEAYRSDEDEEMGGGEEQGPPHAEGEEGTLEQESDQEDLLSALLTPSRLPEAPSVSQLAHAHADVGGASPGSQPEEGAARSGGITSTSQESTRPQLPPELAERPPGEVDPHVQAKVESLMKAKMHSGMLVTAQLKKMKPYKNPDFLQKMVEFFGIDHIGSCYQKEVFDPHGFPKEDYYDKLMEAWEKEQARLKDERMRAGAPQFVKGKPEQAPAMLKGATGAAVLASQIAAAAKAQASAGVKRSKWDSAPRR